MTSYVLATDTQRNQAIELGIEKKIAISLGSARYSYKWHKVLREIEKKIYTNLLVLKLMFALCAHIGLTMLIRKKLLK